VLGLLGQECPGVDGRGITTIVHGFEAAAMGGRDGVALRLTDMSVAPGRPKSLTRPLGAQRAK
jgi:hypothetical protein